MADTSEWVIVGQVTVGGMTYSRGEDLPPAVELDELLRLQQGGQIIRRGDAQREYVPSTAEEYLRATDIVVLANILKNVPPVSVLREIESVAVDRNPVLIGALRVAIMYAERIEQPASADLAQAITEITTQVMREETPRRLRTAARKVRA